MIRLIASDMDGTMLNDRAAFSARTLNAIRRAMDAGCFFSIVSGRVIDAALPLYNACQPNAPIIVCNGAAIYDPRSDKLVFSHCISADLARSVAVKAEEMGIYIQAIPMICNPDAGKLIPGVKMLNYMGSPLYGRLYECIDRDIAKILSIVPAEEAPAVVEELQLSFPDITVTRCTPTNIEISARNVNKASALDVLARRLGIAPEEILAFGDGENDVDMLKYVGIGCAVANAADIPRNCADIIIDSNLDDGPAKFIECMLDEGAIGNQ